MGYVYLICDASNETYKIGVTKDILNKRLKKLQTGNSTQLFISSYYECEYPYRLETMLHSKYRNKNELNEWFNLSAEEVINFKKTCKQIDETIHLLKSNPFFAKNLK